MLLNIVVIASDAIAALYNFVELFHEFFQGKELKNGYCVR